MIPRCLRLSEPYGEGVTKLIKKPKLLKRAEYHSITEAMLVSLGIGLLLGILVGIILKFSVDFWVQAHYVTEDKIEAREGECVADLQDYVTNYGIDSSDKKHIYEWVKSDNYLYILLYNSNGELVFNYGDFYADTALGNTTRPNKSENTDNTESDAAGIHVYKGGMMVKMPTADELFNYASQNEAYKIKFNDVELTIRVAEYSEYMHYALANVLSVLIGILTFLAFLILRIHTLSARIRKLGNDVISVAAGDIEHEIEVDGDDEVAKLSSNVDNMRQSLVFSYKKQKDAQQANAELITAMSHDIRTPLTVLLGYIDMMKMKNEDEELAGYIQASEHTALRLKQMSDDMFNYFRLYGDADLKMELETYPVSTLFSQLLEEHLFMLYEKGYKIDTNIEILNTVQDIEIKTDAPQLARIVENMFSNILKYADKNAPVCVKTDVNAEECKLLFTNTIAKNLDNVESNKIGLKTCAKIASALNIKFETRNDGEVFSAELVIPMREEEDIFTKTVEKKGVLNKLSSTLGKVKGFFARGARGLKTKLSTLFRRKNNDKL